MALEVVNSLTIREPTEQGKKTELRGKRQTHACALVRPMPLNIQYNISEASVLRALLLVHML